MFLLNVPPQSVVAASNSSGHVSLRLWHSRLGYASLSKEQKLVSRGYLGSIKPKIHFHYLACQIEKQHALPFHNSDSLVTALFDPIHSDV